MIRLVGHYDSPFVRRVAIALHHHGIAFDRHVRSVFQDFDEMLAINPLGKVPTLLLSDGTPIFDSKAIIDYLEATVTAETRLTVSDTGSLTRMLQGEAIGIGLAERRMSAGSSLPDVHLALTIRSGSSGLNVRSPKH